MSRLRSHPNRGEGPPAKTRPLMPLLPALFGLGVGAMAAWQVDVGWMLLAHTANVVVARVAWAYAGVPGPFVATRSTLLTLCFPVVGAIAAWLVLPPSGRASGELAASYQAHIAYDTPASQSLYLPDADEALRRELSVRPLVDVLKGGDLAAKQAAADALARDQGPIGVAVLRAALEDEDEETRLFASLALGRAEEAFTGRLGRARALALETGLAADMLNLAVATRAYAESGLPEGAAATALWHDVEDAAQAVVGESTDVSMSWRLLSASRRALGDPPGARRAAAQAWAALGDDVSAAPDAEETLTMLAGALFEDGDLDAVVRLAPIMSKVAAPLSPLHDQAAYWVQGA